MFCVLVSLWPHQVEINTSLWHMCSLSLSFYQIFFSFPIHENTEFSSEPMMDSANFLNENVLSPSTGKQVNGSLLNQMQSGRLDFDYRRAVSLRIFQICVSKTFIHSKEINYENMLFVDGSFLSCCIPFCVRLSQTQLLLFSLSRWHFFPHSLSNAAIYIYTVIIQNYRIWKCYGFTLKWDMSCHVIRDSRLKY